MKNDTKEWINVKDRLPNHNEKVVCLNIKGSGCGGIKYIPRHAIGTYFAGSWSSILRNVTHWMPLPDNPKED